MPTGNNETHTAQTALLQAITATAAQAEALAQSFDVDRDLSTAGSPKLNALKVLGDTARALAEAAERTRP